MDLSWLNERRLRLSSRGHLRPGAGSEPTIEAHAKDEDTMYARSELNIHNDGDRYQARQRWCSDHSIMQVNVIDVQHVMPIRCITMSAMSAPCYANTLHQYPHMQWLWSQLYNNHQ